MLSVETVSTAEDDHSTGRGPDGPRHIPGTVNVISQRTLPLPSRWSLAIVAFGKIDGGETRNSKNSVGFVDATRRGSLRPTEYGLLAEVL